MWKLCVKSVMMSAYIYVCDIPDTSYSTWWHMNQRFEADCCKMCAHLLEDDEKQNQLALCKGLQGHKGKFLVQSRRWKLGSWLCPRNTATVILLPPNRVETDEVRLQEHVVRFLEQWGYFSEAVFFFGASLWSCWGKYAWQSAYTGLAPASWQRAVPHGFTALSSA